VESPATGRGADILLGADILAGLGAQMASLASAASSRQMRLTWVMPDPVTVCFHNPGLRFGRAGGAWGGVEIWLAAGAFSAAAPASASGCEGLLQAARARVAAPAIITKRQVITDLPGM